MTKSIQAVYEHGVLRPLEPLHLSENERVTLTIDSGLQTAYGAAALVALETPLSEEEFDQLLDELASGPALQPLPADFSRADVYLEHD